MGVIRHFVYSAGPFCITAGAGGRGDTVYLCLALEGGPEEQAARSLLTEELSLVLTVEKNPSLWNRVCCHRQFLTPSSWG